MLGIQTDRPEQTVDPDQMPHSVASDQYLHCLRLVHQFFDTLTGSEIDVEFLTIVFLHKLRCHAHF